MTRPFRFRLERIRALRERAEDSAKEDLAASLTHRLKGEAMLRSASARVDGAREATRSAADAPVSGSQLVAAQSYLERAERGRIAAAADLDRREAEVQARRERLGEVARERQALERLKERRRVDHVREQGRIEGAALDEMAITRHRRRRVAR